jgi:4-amino-4-deoxy-L-arabinose transferase-like glycosyltransferase
MQKIFSLVDKYKYWIFGFVILFAVGLRVWNFSDGMLLKGDQIRDAVMSARSFENGLGELPLLGPRAGGTSLRLGPIFYYFQSASAVIFNSIDPGVLALPNLLFSLLAIPIFFVLLRFYFSMDASLILTTLFAFSFLAFEYSRFAWNPNSVPFFVLFFLYAWLQIFSGEEKKRWYWFLLLGFAFAVASQLHFTSMIALGVFAIIFLVFRYKNFWQKIGWMNLTIFLGTILFFYTPVILSDIINKGDNLNLFFKTISNKTSDHSAWKNVSREFYYFGKYYFRMAFGYMGAVKAWHYAGEALLLGGTLLNFLLLRKETEKQRKSFLSLILTWTATFFLLYFPLAYDINNPRFFLPLIFLPYLHLGFLWYWKTSYEKVKKIAVLILAIAMLLGNLAGSLLWLQEFSKAQNNRLDAKETIILKVKKDDAWWTWGMIKRSAAIMSSECNGGAIYYYLPKQSREFEDVFTWAFKLNGEKRQTVFKRNLDLKLKGCFFAVTKQSYDLKLISLQGEFEKVGNSGDIAISKLKRSAADEQVEIEVKKESAMVDEVGVDILIQLHRRVYWKDVFEL